MLNAGLVNGVRPNFLPPENARFFAFSPENARLKKVIKYKCKAAIN
jgi:hypothetical protein